MTEDINKKISNLRDIILIHTDKVLENLTYLLSEENQAHLNNYLVDLRKVDTEAKRLKDNILLQLSPDTLNKYIGGKEFFGYLSITRHDLRNSINVMRGYTEIILEDINDSASLRHFVEKFLENQSFINFILNKINELKIHEVAPQPSENQGLFQSLRYESTPLSVNPSIVSVATPVVIPAHNDNDEAHSNFKENYAILIVDDIKDNCIILQKYLHRLGFKNVKTVSDGFQALAISKRFDLMLLDIDMPGINGIEVLTLLKDDIYQRRLMILMITAADTIENMIECIKLGAEDFLTKPFNVEILRVRIDSCVEQSWYIFNENVLRQKLEYEKRRYKDLLHSIFPPSVVRELTETGKVQTRNYPNVGILFADVVSFTPFCDTHELAEVITNLQDFADMCEKVANETNLQKVKTIGDCFLGVSGMLIPSDNPTLDCVRCAREFIKKIEKFPSKWKLHIGISYGPVIGGIVGKRQYLYDVWGDAVNVAARIQSISEPNTIYLSKNAWDQISKHCKGRSLGEIKMKGKNPLEVFMFEDFIN